jgi:beta-lactamase superfamily II metal-dependent hydrolase
MRVEIFNVGHGAAALMVADNNNLILFDCGHDSGGFRPSVYLPQRWRAVQQLVVSHYDSDHVSDLANLRARMPIERVLSNPTISINEIRRLKLQEGVLTPGMAALLEMKSSFGPVAVEADLAGITIPYFYLPYGPNYADMNNISIVAFVRYADFCAVFPGDIERGGWLALLDDQAFRQNLAAVNVFVASHHGREDGYCEEVFQYCNPDVVVISDGSIQYDSQEHSYDRHAKGLNFSRDGWRYVLTTRCDGHIVIEKKMASGNPFRLQKNVEGWIDHEDRRCRHGCPLRSDGSRCSVFLVFRRVRFRSFQNGDRFQVPHCIP